MRVGIGEVVDHFLADGGSRSVLDVVAAEVAEELLVLELDSLPWRIADDTGESAAPPGRRVGAAVVGDGEDAGELQVPVEEPVLAGKLADQRDHGVRHRCGILGQVRSVAWVMPWPEVWPLFRFWLDEGGAPSVGDEFGRDQFGVGLRVCATHRLVPAAR